MRLLNIDTILHRYVTSTAFGFLFKFRVILLNIKLITKVFEVKILKLKRLRNQCLKNVHYDIVK